MALADANAGLEEGTGQVRRSFIFRGSCIDLDLFPCLPLRRDYMSCQASNNCITEDFETCFLLRRLAATSCLMMADALPEAILPSMACRTPTSIQLYGARLKPAK